MKKIDFFIILSACFAAVMIAGIPCQVRLLFGIPCPTCGMTRAWRLFFCGSIREALHMHPLFWLPSAAILSIIISGRYRTLRSIAILSVIALVGVWIIRMVLYFPGEAPMNINAKAPLIQLIERILQK